MMQNATRKRSLGSDLLALLDKPGGSSDLTITAAGGRSFNVHSSIVSARCGYVHDQVVKGMKDIQLRNADPDALNLLLRYIYGDILDPCERKILQPAIELADQLRLCDASGELKERFVRGVSAATIVEDMLWAEQLGYHELLDHLESAYVIRGCAPHDAQAATTLAMRSPLLLARLHTAVLESWRSPSGRNVSLIQVKNGDGHSSAYGLWAKPASGCSGAKGVKGSG